jgi:hypothetical protein
MVPVNQKSRLYDYFGPFLLNIIGTSGVGHKLRFTIRSILILPFSATGKKTDSSLPS